MTQAYTPFFVPTLPNHFLKIFPRYWVKSFIAETRKAPVENTKLTEASVQEAIMSFSSRFTELFDEDTLYKQQITEFQVVEAFESIFIKSLFEKWSFKKVICFYVGTEKARRRLLRPCIQAPQFDTHVFEAASRSYRCVCFRGCRKEFRNKKIWIRWTTTNCQKINLFS